MDDGTFMSDKDVSRLLVIVLSRRVEGNNNKDTHGLNREAAAAISDGLSMYQEMREVLSLQMIPSF